MNKIEKFKWNKYNIENIYKIPKHITPKQNYLIEYAKQIAIKSVMNYKHGAILVSRNKILGEGYNKLYNRKPLISNSDTYTINLSNCYSIHAENACLKDAIKKNKNKLESYDLELYVIRVSIINNNYYLRDSKPSENCKKLIENYTKKYKINKIYYSIDELNLNIKYNNKFNNY